METMFETFMLCWETNEEAHSVTFQYNDVVRRYQYAIVCMDAAVCFKKPEGI